MADSRWRACPRRCPQGMIHSVVFAGFSAEALRDRIVDAASPMVVVADQGLRGGKAIELKKICDAALEGLDVVKTCFVYKRTGAAVNMKDGGGVHCAFPGGCSKAMS